MSLCAKVVEESLSGSVIVVIISIIKTLNIIMTNKEER